jgi:hypothetical protein
MAEAEEEGTIVRTAPVPETEEDDDDAIDGGDAVDESDGSIHLNTIWDDDMIILLATSWKCLWCNKTFQGRHASKAVAHVAKVKGLSIAVSLFLRLRIAFFTFVIRSDYLLSFFLSFL